jgi:RHS repeat-associated protein
MLTCGDHLIGCGLLLIALLVTAPSAEAQACDAANPWFYAGTCYADRASAEYAMRNPTEASGKPKGGNWTFFYELKEQIGNKYIYHLPPKPHLPNPSWRTSMTNGDYAWGWRGYVSPLFHTWQGAEAWMKGAAKNPTYYAPHDIVSDDLIYRGSYFDASANERRAYSHNYTSVPVSLVDFTAANLAHFYQDFNWVPGTEDAKVSKGFHTVIRYRDTTPEPAVEHINGSQQIEHNGVYFAAHAMPVIDIYQIYFGLCQAPYTSDGMQCVSDSEAVIFYGAQHVLEAPAKPPKKCSDKNNESNPCNPADGSKSQVEVDYSSPANGGLEFARYYSSMGAHKTDPYFQTGWRHTYSRRLNEIPDVKPQVSFAAPANQSSFYYSAADACTSGWNDLKNSVWSGDLASATASFVGGNVCKISMSGNTVAYFPVRSPVGWSGYAPSPTVKFITRPDGSSIEFEFNGTNWVNYLNSSLSLIESGGNWIFTDENDTKETFDSAGRLVAITTRDGRVTTLQYNLGSGGDYNPDTLDKVTGPFGHVMLFGYDPVYKRLRSVRTPDNRYTNYFFDHKNLTEVRRPDATSRKYLYEEPGLGSHLTGIIDENGDRIATWDYDSAGRAILSEHAGGKEQVTFAYNTDGSTTLTTGGGAVRNYVYSTQQGERKVAMLTGDVCSTCPGGNIADRTYDSNGYLQEVIDWNGNVTETIRNTRGLTETLTEAKGSAVQRVTDIDWHPTFRLPTQITTPKNQSNFTYDSNGNLLTVVLSGGGKARQWTFTYNAFGQPLTIDGPRTDVTDVTTLEYYECTTSSMCGELKSVTNALGQVTNYNTYDGNARLTKMTDANGLQTLFTYNLRGKLTKVTQIPVSASARYTYLAYDNASQLITVTMPDGMVLTYDYDAAHYLRSVTDNFGSRIEYDYDAMGNLKDVDTYDPGSTLKRALSYSYDLNNRLDSVTHGGFVTNLALDMVGNLTEEVDPKLATTHHAYDALNRMDETIDALSGITDYEYDSHDNLEYVLAPNGATTTYEYDALDDLIKEISPDRGTTVYTYDDAGNRITDLDARGKLTTYSYDALNRLTLVTLHDSSTVAYEYDVGSNAIGRLNEVSDSSGQSTWTYNNFGEATQKVQTIGPVTLKTGYTYDSKGRLTGMSLPSGKALTFSYNVYQPTTVKVNGVTILSGATYDPFGPVNGWTWGNTTPHNRSFDLRGLLDSQSMVIDTRTIGYDNAGRLITLDDARHNLGFGYDALGQLTGFTASGSAPLSASQYFTYDENGNRQSITENGTPYTYTNPAFSNRLTSTTGPTAKSFTYDAAGNVTSDNIHSYAYDDRGRLVSADSGAVTYAHNGQGQRVKKDGGSATTLFVYDEAGQLIGEYDGLGNVIQETVWFNGAPVAVLTGSNAYYVHTDHLGTPRSITDGNTVIWRWESDPFGTTAAQEDPDGDLTDFTYNLRFPGQYYDGETGLHYNYFRDYDPSTGRYIQSDPIGLFAELNPYSYVGQSPLDYDDRYGLQRAPPRPPPRYNQRGMINPNSPVRPPSDSQVARAERAQAMRDYYRQILNSSLENWPDLSGIDASKVVEEIRELQRRSLNYLPDRTDALEFYRNFQDLEDCTRPDIVERWKNGPWIGPIKQWQPLWLDPR